MAKKSKTETTAQPSTPAQAPTRYMVVAPKRNLTGVKFGQSGNAFTHEKLLEAAQANGGMLTWEQVVATCTAAQHKRFANYALNRLKVLVPVVE